MNIVDEIFKHADRAAPALICGDEVLRYGELKDLVECAAEGLTGAGALEAEGVTRIGLSCPNGTAYVILALAIVRSGACLVPVAGELSGPERDALASATGLHAVVIAPGGGWDHRLRGRAVDTELGAVRATLVFGLRRGREARPLAFDERILSAMDPAFIRFSSGTTGTSKGIVLSHRTLRDRVAAANMALRIGPGDRVIWILPMAHHFAVSIMLYLMHGAATVIVNSHLAEDLLDAALKHGGTVIYGAPFHHAMLAVEPSGRPWPGLRLAVSTAAGLSLATARAFDARFGVPLSQALGLIEVGLPLVNVGAPREKPDSVGCAIPDFSVEVRDENGAPAAPGEPGELFLRGPGMLDAYLSPWRTREEILENGWFRTGDLATLDAEAFVRLAGRAHTVINVAGMKCFPEEIEAVLCAHPEIRAARVTGKPHPKFGAVPVAALVARDPARPPGASSIVTHCQKSLARFKVPVGFEFVESLPLTPSGKIRR